MIEDAAESIVARLKAEIPQFKVDHFPADIPKYAFAAQSQTLLVFYEGSTYAAPASLSPLASDRDVEFGVAVLVRSLRGATGAQVTIDRVRNALFGWRPTKDNGEGVQVPIGLSVFVPTKDECIGENQGIWRFDVFFSSKTIAVARTTPLTGPPFKGATAKDAA